MQPNNLAKIFKEISNPEECIKQYNTYIQKMLSEVVSLEIVKTAELFLEARSRGSTIFFIGNGGSASTASHFAQDLVDCARKAGEPTFRSLSLTDNVSYITALGNDHGYSTIFTEQLRSLFQPRDLLVAISASGNSPNIIQSVKLVKETNGTCIGIVGFDGGELARLADHCIHIRTPYGEYGPVESLHVLVLHMITSYIYFVLKDQSLKVSL